MKKKFWGFFSVFFFFLLGINFVDATTITATECEYTDAYKKWLKLSEKEREEVLQPAMCKTNSNFFSLVGNSSVKESFTSTKFDLRNYNAVSEMKDQSNTMACWTFATMESIESNLRFNQKGSYDLSEAHLELSTQNSLFDSLVPFSRNFNVGGNYSMSAAYLMNRIGPVEDNAVPFNIVTDAVAGTRTPTLADISNKEVKFSVNDVVLYSDDQGACSNDSITSIKKYLVSNGAMGASIYFEMYPQDISLNGSTLSGKFLNGQYYYYDGSEYINVENVSVDENQTINHAVTIIGWDDTISKDNFSTKPSRDGAWLVKNSYGESLKAENVTVDMGDKGYYYISYDDINICTLVAGFYNIDTEIEDNVYYHDKLGGVGEYPLNYNMDIYLANIFQRTKIGSEMLEKVTFYNFESSNRKFDIIYGTDLNNMSVIYSGVADHTGVVTVDVDPINLTGESFVVGIKFYQSSSFPVYFNLTKVEDFEDSFFGIDVPKNVSFISVDGQNWTDLYNGGIDYLLPLRVYTTDADYTFGPAIYNITSDTIEINVDYDKISDLNNIEFYIYDKNDADFRNPLNNNFSIDNQLASSKKIKVSLNDSSFSGSYKMVVSYKYTKLVGSFDIVEEGESLVFKRVDVSNNENNGPDFVVNDNPNNDDIELPKEEVNISENPKTGMIDVVIVVVVLVLSVGMLVFYWFYDLKKNNEF